MAPSPTEGEIGPDNASEPTSREQAFELCFAVPDDVLVGPNGVLELSAMTTSALKRWANTYADAAAARQREVDALLATREPPGEGEAS